jgi:hypothetical protein
MALALCLFSQSGGFLALLHSLTPTPGLFLTAFSPLFTAPITSASSPLAPMTRCLFAKGTAISTKRMVRTKRIFAPFQ